MAIKKTHEQFVLDIINAYNIKREDFELLTQYKGWDQPITFKCNRCGLEKTVLASNLLKKRKNKKNICRCYGYDAKWHEQLKQFNQWREEQNQFKLLEDFKGSEVNLLVQCTICGAVQRRSIKSLIQNQGCQNCQSKQGLKKTPNQFKQELFNLYGGEYEAIGDYKDANTPILIRHTLCGKIYSTKPHNILSNKGGHCPICKVISKGEKAIALFLDAHNIQYETQKRLPELKKCPFDFFLPDFNLLIEYQGIQHFEPVSRFGGVPSFNRQQEIDALKKQIAIDTQHNLMIINYTDYSKINTLLAQRLSCDKE